MSHVSRYRPIAHTMLSHTVKLSVSTGYSSHTTAEHLPLRCLSAHTSCKCHRSGGGRSDWNRIREWHGAEPLHLAGSYSARGGSSESCHRSQHCRYPAPQPCAVQCGRKCDVVVSRIRRKLYAEDHLYDPERPPARLLGFCSEWGLPVLYSSAASLVSSVCLCAILRGLSITTDVSFR